MRQVQGSVRALSGARHEYHVPHFNDPGNMRNLARNLAVRIAERDGLSEAEQEETRVHVLQQLVAEARKAPAVAGDGYVFRNGAKVKSRAAA